MTKLLYIHDSLRLKRDSNGRLYTDSNYSPDVWRRYTEVAEEVTAVFRQATGVVEPDVGRRSLERIPENVRCVGIPDHNRSLVAYLSRRDRKALRQLMHSLTEEHDALIVRLPSYAGSIALAHARTTGRPVMVEVVGCAWDTLWNHSLAGKLLAPWAFLRMRRSAGLATHAVYVTRFFLQRRYPCSGKTLVCPDVVMDPADSSSVRNRISRLTSPESRPFVLGTAGAVNVRYKGHDLVIRALADLRGGARAYQYRIAGGGDQSRLRHLAAACGVSDQVTFLGALSRSEVVEFYDELDLYVQPSRSEGLPRALMEAMSRGCPAVGSSAGGIPELLSADAVFQSGSRQAFAAVLRKAISASFLESQATRNWESAMLLQASELEKKRQRFVREFLAHRHLK